MKCYVKRNNKVVLKGYTHHSSHGVSEQHDVEEDIAVSVFFWNETAETVISCLEVGKIFKSSTKPLRTNICSSISVIY